MATAAIIGAGMGGLAAAIRLAVQGYEVQVFDRMPYTGGKVSKIEDKGFQWDAGPSLFTLPEHVDELFTLAGRQDPLNK